MTKFSNKNALVVEDSVTTAKMLSFLLKNLGFSSVDIAWNGTEALAKMKEQHVDLILTDWNLPEMDGLDLLKAIRGNEGDQKPRVVMITSENRKDKIQKTLQCGVDAYIMKPFSPKNLEDKIHQLFSDP